ncbi:beta-ketoacyl synthase N-terminal-like domain-containing protein [Chromobacterium sp. IIBBL 290-4]|uniref:beta-ketoacyl synthase N-terminal-like domain-containing protein n=1 Tax=Chromobacterium sp. IIBBL 290-4 TaxID=2953890 RepID=UPI0020B88243|nr:beta-ketoacyl synthase N-terminal-like domain-containing protein [Chromobacterium sp. IIBBL 290-4]UTH76431.1 phosphopantetheine-binding protein [Chromobacterium sp. IIBBL 290-4]
MAGRYPGAENLGDFWRVLNEGCDCITEIPAERWDHAHYFDPDRNAAGKTYTKWGGFIEGVDCFDAAFFNISPREAAIMEPQERLFLQTAYEAIEDAGYTRQSLASNATIHGVAGSVGVFVGVTYEEYQLYAAEATARGEPMVLSMSPSSIANRVSYFCNFHGPSMAVDAMCASSLTTVHLACQSLKNGECRVALAGGVNVSIHPAKYLMLGKGKFASSKGRCESFGAGGDGYVPSEGVGAVLLKPLGAALADKDRIYGVIRGSAINHGGKTNGYAVPNPNAQADVVARAIANAAVDARQISYVEAHGTGTVLGDPIEIAGISKAYRAHTQDSGFCAIGSVKSNIGHCESAAGIAGLTKVLLQMKYRKLVPSLHAHTLNANINFDSTPFKVQQTLTEWAPRSTSGESLPLIAGVSSFGAGGTNAHLIVAEWPQTRAVSIDSPREPVAIVLSAKNAEALRVQAERMAAWIRAHEAEGFDVRAMAYTLQVGREAMDHRLAFLAENVAQVMASIDAFLHGGAATTGLRFGQAREGQPTPTAAARSSLEQSAWSRDLPTLLRHWVDGGEVPWSLLYDGEPPARLSLPTYPFSRQRYWLPKRTVSAGLGVTLCQDGTATAPGKIKLRPLHTLADTPAAPSRQAAASSVPTGGMASKDEAVAPMPQLDVESMLTAWLADVLYMSAGDISQDKPFIDLGLDSVVGAEWIRSVNKHLGLALPSSVAYEHSTIKRLARHVQSLMAGQAPSAAVAKTAPAVMSAVHPRESDRSGTLSRLEQMLSASLADVLYMSAGDIPQDKPFIDLGLDSVVGAEWMRTVNKNLGLALPASVVYEQATIRQLARYLHGQGAGNVPVGASAADAVPVAAPAALVDESTRSETLSRLERMLSASLADVLYMSAGDIPQDKSFIDLGLDSVVGAEWMRTVNKSLGLALPASVVYEQATIRQLARYLHGQGAGNVPVGASAADAVPVAAPAALVDESTRSETLSRLEQMLSASLADVLYMSAGDIPQDKPFIDLGLDSVVGAEWMRTVNKSLGLALPVSVVYEYVTIRRLARHLYDQGAGGEPEPFVAVQAWRLSSAPENQGESELDAILAQVRSGELEIGVAQKLIDDVLQKIG